MPDDYNISYSYQTASRPDTPAPPVDEPLIAFANCEIINLDKGSVLVLNRNNGKQLTVTPEVATALTHCTTFRPLQEHARTLATTIPQLQDQQENITQVLRMVNDAGLMSQAGTITARLAPADIPEATLAPSRVFIITCDRPAAVERLLDSMLQSCHLGGHDQLFLVDDSRDPGNAELNRELVAKFNRSSPRELRYVGATAQRRLMDMLITGNPQHEAGIRFLLDRERWASHKSYGLARTVCLLLSVGYRCIVLDDDVLCRAVQAPVQAEGITFGGGANRELACFGSQQELMTQAIYADTDPLSGHALCLGMNLAQALRELGSAEINQDSLRGVNATMLNTLQANSPVLVTQCGSWGDPGVPGSSWFTHLDKASLKRVLAAPGGLPGAMQNRYYWLGRPRPNIGKMAVMSQVTGLDNSQMLPPYFPVSRGEDYLFASMVLYLHPNSAVLDYNWSVPHLPLDSRPGGDPDKPAVPRGDLGLCARYLADQVDYEAGGSAKTRLGQLALMLHELGERQPDKLLATFRTQLTQQRADQMRQLNSQLRDTPAQESRDWEDFLRKGLEAVTSALQSPASPVDMPDTQGGLTEELLQSQISQGIGVFGRSLEAWPDIRRAAVEASRQMLDSGELQP